QTAGSGIRVLGAGVHVLLFCALPDRHAARRVAGDTAESAWLDHRGGARQATWRRTGAGEDLRGRAMKPSNLKWRCAVAAAFASLAAVVGLVPAANAADHGAVIERQDWPFAGFTGQYDRAQLQRGFQVYQQVCTACHSLDRVRFRNLAE